MKVFFANSAWVKVPERLVIRGGQRRKLSLKVRYGIALHPEEGPVLIDTGYGPRVCQGAQRSGALKLYNRLIGPILNPLGAPELVLQNLGFDRDAVRHIVVTHFHADHVAALSRFPNARIIARRSAFEAIQGRSRFGNLRHGIFPELLPKDLPSRLVDTDGLTDVPAPRGLGSGKDLFGDGSILAIDLPGHAEGHFGLCFTQLETPLLYAVDVQWLRQAAFDQRIPGFPSSVVATDPKALAASAKRIASFHDAGGDVVLCHDPAVTRFDIPETADA